MPVLSPHRSSSSSLSGSYRSTYSTSGLDRPYTNSYHPRVKTYSEHFTTRSYIDTDGRRLLSRTGSITEDGITTRFREDTREPSTRRDSLARDAIREGSVYEGGRLSNGSGALGGREPRFSALSVVDSIAEMQNKYSPANYVPAVLRKKENMARSKSINDIGLPADAAAKKDDNGNRPSVLEIRRKFDKNGDLAKAASPPLVIEGVKIAENPFKKEDSLERRNNEARKRLTNAKQNGDVHIDKCDKSDKSDKGDKGEKGLKGEKRCDSKLTAAAEKKAKAKVNKKEEAVNGTDPGRRRANHDTHAESLSMNGAGTDSDGSEGGSRHSVRTNNFASYISTKDYDKGDPQTAGEQSDDGSDAMDKSNLNKRSGHAYKPPIDVSSVSPRLSRGISQNANSTSPSGPSSSNRNSLERDHYDRFNVTSSGGGGNLGLNGLKNIGNTCFMNSVIQCLSNTKLLLEYLKKDGYVDEINTTTSSMKGALIKAFSQVIKELWSEDSSDRVVNTLAFKSQVQRYAPRFIGYAQQDAQEFLRYLLEGLHEDVNRVTSKPTPIITEIDEKLSDEEKATESWRRYLRVDNSKVVDIFVGQLKSTLRCTHCGHCSVTFDPFWDLSLPIPQKAGPVKLSQCLEYFTREETMDGDEKPTCSKCKERRKCTKSFTIQKFPKILVIHLKRFSPTERYRGKLSITVDFPLEALDMRNYAADNVADSRYNLYAISNHSGTTYSGHYTAYCRHPYTHTWHEYNDSRVSSMSSKNLVSGEAYVLFYELDSQKAHL